MIEKEDHKGLIVFQDKKIRRLWHDNQWFYSVVDIVAVLSESDNPATYWRVLKHREPQLVTICNGLKMSAEDGRMVPACRQRSGKMEFGCLGYVLLLEGREI